MLRLSVLLILLLLVACGGGIYHTVKPGQNLYRISRAYNVSETYLAKINRISDPTRIKVGTRLYIPGANKVRHVEPVKVSTPSPPPHSPKPAPVRNRKAPVPTTKPEQKTAHVGQAKATSVKKLNWPLRGKIVRSFSTQTQAGGGKGIEIAVRVGSPVLAAEAGKAIYSGDGVNGYGHLIILQHENELFTVYGFNQQNLIRQGDFVSQGEKIALSGVPPAGGQARLHFEVRKGKLAVDPILYLP
jgi:lipoprotein NlpD